eukprot:scaffold2.g6934.t1
MEVTRHNFGEALPRVRAALDACDYFAFDCEMTGLFMRDDGGSYLDEIEDRYLEMVESAQGFVISQFGLSTFAWSPQEGAFCASLSTMGSATCQTDEEALLLDSCNSYQAGWGWGGRAIQYQELRKPQFGAAQPPGFYVERVEGEDGRPALRLRRAAPGEVAAFEEEQRRARIQAVHDAAGFTAVFEAMRDSRKPAVGHNLSFDLAYSLASYAGPLPPSWEAYKAMVARWFPGGVYDTKHLARQLPGAFPDTTLGVLHDGLLKGGLQEQVNAFLASLRDPAAAAAAAAAAGTAAAHVAADEAAAAEAGALLSIDLLPEVGHAPGYERYEGADTGQYAHEAGYDAYMTGERMVWDAHGMCLGHRLDAGAPPALPAASLATAALSGGRLPDELCETLSCSVRASGSLWGGEPLTLDMDLRYGATTFLAAEPAPSAQLSYGLTHATGAGARGPATAAGARALALAGLCCPPPGAPFLGCPPFLPPHAAAAAAAAAVAAAGPGGPGAPPLPLPAAALRGACAPPPPPEWAGYLGPPAGYDGWEAAGGPGGAGGPALLLLEGEGAEEEEEEAMGDEPGNNCEGGAARSGEKGEGGEGEEAKEGEEEEVEAGEEVQGVGAAPARNSRDAPPRPVAYVPFSCRLPPPGAAAARRRPPPPPEDGRGGGAPYPPPPGFNLPPLPPPPPGFYEWQAVQAAAAAAAAGGGGGGGCAPPQGLPPFFPPPPGFPAMGPPPSGAFFPFGPPPGGGPPQRGSRGASPFEHRTQRKASLQRAPSPDGAEATPGGSAERALPDHLPSDTSCESLDECMNNCRDAAEAAAAAAAAAWPRQRSGEPTPPVWPPPPPPPSAAACAARAARAACLLRCREKKARRSAGGGGAKRIRYQMRKINADRRPRVKGRFVKAAEAEAMNNNAADGIARKEEEEAA